MHNKVIGIEWNISKHGVLKPVIIDLIYYVEQLIIKQLVITRILLKNKIGKGAMIKLIKGGEIIPKVEELLFRRCY